MATADTQKHNVIIALGTNTEREDNMQRAIIALNKIVKDMRLSRQLLTPPIGMGGNNFLNRLVAGSCSLCPDELKAATKRIEKECGRNEGERQAGIVRMDIDILKYDEHLEHVDDWDREYIKELIKEL